MMDHLSFTTPYALPPSKEASALLDETTESLSHVSSSTPARTSDASTQLKIYNLSDNTIAETLYDRKSPIGTNSTEGVGHTSGLEPTYKGYISTKEEAHILLEACLFGYLRLLPRGPHPDELRNIVQSGNVILYKYHASDIKDWDDEIHWLPKYQDNDFWISHQKTDTDELRKRDLSIFAQGAFYRLISYYGPWETVGGTLRIPSQDPHLRDTSVSSKLASQQMIRKEQLFLYSELAVGCPR